MHDGGLVIVLVLVFGCAAFFFGVIYVLCQFFALIGRGILGVLRPRRPGGAVSNPLPGPRPRVCRNDRCRKVERRSARYCSQCGTPLR